MIHSSRWTVLIVAGWALATAGADDFRLPETIRFDEHVRPIFTKNCTACHGGVQQAGDVSFIYKDQVLPPEGWIVEPGDPDSSALIQRILETDPELRMPPPDHGPPLSDRDTALLTEWIRQGAVWNADHWAYAAPRRQPVPDVSDESWPHRRLDHFVLAKLDEQRLGPSRDASPERWLRRVSLDLTGLPPTRSRRQSFLDDFQRDADLARSSAVDRMLQSPSFGERWGSVWLDQVRYADSKGLGLDGRRTAWKYRDWVIDAINQDLPFDQFTIKQMAGDLLPDATISDRIATAAHRVTQTNEEGGTDDEEFRIAAVLDRVNTTWQAWQGVTFGCVQCHAHPYDPFRHEEYYQFSAFFNDTSDCDLGEDWPLVHAPLDPRDNGRANQLDREIKSLRHSIWQDEYRLLNDSSVWTPLTDLEASSNNATEMSVQRVGDHDEFHTVGTVSRNLTITLQAPTPEIANPVTAIRLTVLPLDPVRAVADSEWGFVLSHCEASLLVAGEDSPRKLSIDRLIIDEPEPFLDPQLSLNAKSPHGFSAYTRIHYPRQAALIFKTPIEVPPGSRWVLQLKHQLSALGAFALVTRRGHLAVTDDPRFTERLTGPEPTARRQQLASLEKSRKSIPSVSVPVLKQRPDHLSRPTHLFQRGLFLTKGRPVSAAVPETLWQSDQAVPGDRLAMARWLVSPENPLTARVFVNRVWARLFGVGLVATEEDFGSSGEPPTHPRLLDDLAVRFRTDMGWSVKRLIREIALSRTYAQTSTAGAAQYQQDPDNRWLSRGPRHRLASEIVRDQALAFAGLLSEKRFGPPVHPPIPDGVWKPFKASDHWTLAKKNSGDRYRRSIYTYTKRSIPYPMFAAFDSPSREFCAPRRLRSNTPTQALTMLNDVTFSECAEGLARRMRQADPQVREQIRHGFLIVTSREPRSGEWDDLLALYEATDDGDGQSGLTAVATVLLNLDEVVMK